MLKAHNVPVVDDESVLNEEQQLCLAVTFARSMKMPCVKVAPFTKGFPIWGDGCIFYFKYGEAVKESDLHDWVLSAMPSDIEKQAVVNSDLATILGNLIETFYEENAAFVYVRVAKSSNEEYVAVSYLCNLDDAALRLNKTPEELQALREEQKFSREEVAAAKEGIVYWR